MKRTDGIVFLLLSLFAFMGLGIELLYAFLVEPILYNKGIQQWTTTQNISHWMITCITWGIVSIVLIKVSKNKFKFDLFISKGKMKNWQYICVLICIIFSFVVSYLDWNGFKIMKEFQYNGLIKFIFQYIYYAFETVLFMLIIVFGQKGFEIIFRKENIPYGGIVVAITWGFTHILTKGNIQEGLLSALGGFVYGLVYLLLNKDIKKTVLVSFCMFII